MKMTKNYSGFTTMEEKLAEALKDVKFYLGDKKYDSISAIMRQATTQEHFIIYADMVGVRGFPIIAWYEDIHGKDSWKDMEDDNVS